MFTCNTCGETKGGEAIAALEHDWQETTAKVEAECGKAGSEAVYTCANGCGETKGGEAIAALEHDWQETAAKVEAECEKAGSEAVYTCANGCGETKGGEEIPALEHDWQEAEGKVDPDCETAGKEVSYICINGCDGTKGGEEIPAAGHAWTAVEAKEATCTADGYIAHWDCDNCDAIATGEAGSQVKVEASAIVAAAKHTLATAEAQAATCTQVGWEAYEYCTACDYTEKEEFFADHTFIDGVCANAECGILVEATYLSYNGSFEGVAYADGKWTVTAESGKIMKFSAAAIKSYTDKKMGTLVFTFTSKSNQETSLNPSYNGDNAGNKKAVVTVDLTDEIKQNGLEMRIYYVSLGWTEGMDESDGFVVSVDTGSYTESTDTVASNASFKVTVKLTETMAREGMSMYVYFHNRGWSGDTAGVDGFTVSFVENRETSLAKNWIVGQNLDVAFDGSIYMITNANGGNLTSGYQHIAISEDLIDKMLKQGHTTLSFTFKVSGGSPYDFDVPNVNSASTVTLNIADLSSNGDASSYYNPEGYFPLRLYINNTKSSAKMYITFTETPVETYSIVYSKNAEATEINAAKMLATHLEEATGVAYDVVSDRHVAWMETGKYISVGQTSLLSEVGFSALAENNVSGDGYIRRTVGNTLFIDGITERGTLYGVLDYLEDAYGYVFISDDVYSYTANPNLVISDLDKDFTPTFETRTYLNYGMYASNTNANTVLYNKANSYYLNASEMSGYGGVNNIGYIGARDHNMYDTLVEGVALYNTAYGTSYVATDFAQSYKIGSAIYYNPCLSGGKSKNGLTALDFMTLAMKNCILGQYTNGVRYYSLTQEDTNGSDYCTCSTCTSQASAYGRSGLIPSVRSITGNPMPMALKVARRRILL